MIRPFDRRVLIERESAAETFKGIIIPSRYRQAPQEGLVRAIGDKVTTVKPGDRVLFGRHSGIQMDQPGYLMLWERDLMAVIDEGSTAITVTVSRDDAAWWLESDITLWAEQDDGYVPRRLVEALRAALRPGGVA